MPYLGRRLKIHLVLHLADNILEFGPPAHSAQKGMICMYIKCTFSCILSVDSSHLTPSSEDRMHSNHHAPSREITYNFSVLNTSFQFVQKLSLAVLPLKGMCTFQCHFRRQLFEMHMYIRCGQGLSNLYHSTSTAAFELHVCKRTDVREGYISARLSEKCQAL